MTDKDGNGMIDQTEMFAVTSLLATGNNKEKLNFLFTMYDENGEIKEQYIYWPFSFLFIQLGTNSIARYL